jgi:hypothetical protein
MSTMVRKQIYIEPRQEALLKQVAAETGMTEAEIIRQALDLWEEDKEKRRRSMEAWKEARAFIEERIAQGPLPGGRRWTREELYDERLNGYGRDSD